MLYTVQYGDTLGGIAANFGVSVWDIMRANNLHHFSIYPGQRLWIPGAAPAPAPHHWWHPAPAPAPSYHHWTPAPQHVQHHYYDHH